MSKSAVKLSADPGDAALVEAARGGDRQAFGELVARHQNLVRAITFAVIRNLSLSEEAAQEAFASAFCRLHELRKPELFRSWLRHIAQNLAANVALRSKRGRVIEWARMDDRTQVPSPEPSPLDRMIRHEEEVCVQRALRHMPMAYRVPLLLYYREQKSVEKVAEALNLSEENVNQRLSRGRRILQQNVMALLESVLSRTSTEKAFTAATMAALLLVEAGRAAAAAPGARSGGPMATRTLLGKTVLGAGLAIIVAGPFAWLGGGGVKRLASAPRAARAPVALSTVDVLGLPLERGGLAAGATEARGAAMAGLPGDPLLSFDFEDGVLPEDIELGHVLPGPERAGSRYAVTGTLNPVAWQYSVRIRTRNLRYRDTLYFAFDYWTASRGDEIGIELWNQDRRANYKIGLTPNSGSTLDAADATYLFEEVKAERWSHVVFPLARMVPLKDVGPWQPGDMIGKIEIDTSSRPGGQPFFIDNVRLFLLDHRPGE